MGSDVPCGCAGETGGVEPASRPLPDAIKQRRKQKKRQPDCPGCLTKNYALGCRNCLKRPSEPDGSGVILSSLPSDRPAPET